MSLPVFAGAPDVSFRTNPLGPSLIPTLFSAIALKKMREEMFLAEISNGGEYIGALKSQGDTIYIPTVPTIAIGTHVKYAQSTPSFPQSPSIQFQVNRGKDFNIGISKVDAKQSVKDWLPSYAEAAAKDTKIAIEKEVFANIYTKVSATNKGLTAGKLSANINLGTIAAPVVVTKTNAVEMILRGFLALTENNWPSEMRYVVVPAWFAMLLKLSELFRSNEMGDSKSTLRTGLVGMIDGAKVYSSNLLNKDAGTNTWHVIFGHRAGLAYIDQMVDVEYYSHSDYIAHKFIKGLTVYDFDAIQPTAMGEIVVVQ